MEKEIIDFLRESKARGANEIVAALGMSKKDKKGSRDIFEKLEMEGKIVKTKGERYTIPEKLGYISGTLEVVKERYGFVDTEAESFFIKGSNFNGAMSGDKVFITVVDAGDDNKKREAKVQRVIKRSRDYVTGIYQNSGRFGFVIPRESFGSDVYVTKENTHHARDGELVVVKILSWGSEDKKPEGRITEVLGNPYDTGVLMEALLRKFGYSETFPINVSKEAEAIKEPQEDKAEFAKRKDLTKLPIITIDGDDAKDFDDAVYVEKLLDGNYRLIVSIADVSHYVKEGSELDKEALKRSNSVYLVDRVIPMFPEVLSNGICSLNEKVPRFTFTVDMVIDSKGKIVSEETYKSIIKSVHRMTYKKVNKILNGDVQLIEEYKDIYEMVLQMKELASIIREKRFKRGSIDFDLSETKVVLGTDGKVDRVELRERGESEKIIEDFMIMANETVAEKVHWLEIPLLYRIHEKPDMERIKLLNEFLKRFGYRIHGLADLHPGKFQRIIEETKDKEYKLLLSKMILMSLKQARYSIDNVGHFGLASTYYAHFTSPIRRYADLVVHRVLNDIICSKTSKKRIVELEELINKAAEATSFNERKAMEAEDESVKIKIVEYMKDRVGDIFDARVAGMNKNGLFIETAEHIECFMDINSLRGEFVYDEKNYKILEKRSNKEYNVGDALKVMISRVSQKEMTIEAIPYEGDGRNGYSIK